MPVGLVGGDGLEAALALGVEGGAGVGGVEVLALALGEAGEGFGGRAAQLEQPGLAAAGAGEGQGKLVFQNHTDGRNILTLESNGSLGVGTTAPADALLDVMYGSRYMTHFYSPQEIERLRKRWSGRGEA